MNVKLLQAKDVAEKVLFGELFILDVRNETDYEDWKIEGKQVTSINKPYFDLLEGVDHIVDELPREKDILVVCAKEGLLVCGRAINRGWIKRCLLFIWWYESLE